MISVRAHFKINVHVCITKSQSKWSICISGVVTWIEHSLRTQLKIDGERKHVFVILSIRLRPVSNLNFMTIRPLPKIIKLETGDQFKSLVSDWLKLSPVSNIDQLKAWVYDLSPIWVSVIPISRPLQDKTLEKYLKLNKSRWL